MAADVTLKVELDASQLIGRLAEVRKRLADLTPVMEPRAEAFITM